MFGFKKRREFAKIEVDLVFDTVNTRIIEHNDRIDRGIKEYQYLCPKCQSKYYHHVYIGSNEKVRKCDVCYEEYTDDRHYDFIYTSANTVLLSQLRFDSERIFDDLITREEIYDMVTTEKSKSLLISKVFY